MEFFPDSSYSFRVTHIFLKVASEAKMDPPIHVEFIRSGGAQILILVSRGANFLTSESKRSPKPSNKVEPPASMISEKKGSTNIHVTFRDGIDKALVNSDIFQTNQSRIEQNFWSTKLLCPYLYDISVR